MTTFINTSLFHILNIYLTDFVWMDSMGNIETAYISQNKLDNIIKVHKDSIPKEKLRGVVYQIKCKDCESAYVGQTKRQLATRIKEHHNNLRHNTALSVVSQHRLQGHEFDWQHVNILDREKTYYKRMVSEMIYINLQKLPINKKDDTDNLHDCYNSIFQRIKEFSQEV